MANRERMNRHEQMTCCGWAQNWDGKQARAEQRHRKCNVEAGVESARHKTHKTHTDGTRKLWHHVEPVKHKSNTGCDEGAEPLSRRGAAAKVYLIARRGRISEFEEI